MFTLSSEEYYCPPPPLPPPLTPYLFTSPFLFFWLDAHTVKSATFAIPEDIRQYLVDPTLAEVTFQYTDPIHALVSMLHFNPLAANWDNLAFTYEESDAYDDYCTGDRMKRIQESIPAGSAQLNGVMYFDGIQQDQSGWVSVDGGLIVGGYFRKEAREQNEAMRSICSFVKVSPCSCKGYGGSRGCGRR